MPRLTHEEIYMKAGKVAVLLEDLLKDSGISPQKAESTAEFMIGEDGFDWTLATNLQESFEDIEIGIGKSLAQQVVRYFPGKGLVRCNVAMFTKFVTPKAFNFGKHIERPRSITRVIEAFDPFTSNFVQRADFLFRLMWPE